MPLEVWSGQFHLLHGDARQFGPYAGSFRGPGAGTNYPELFLVFQPLSPTIVPAVADLLPKLGTIFERESLSLTGALIRCVAAAHEQVHAWNQRSLAAHRAGLALAGLALRGDQAYLALAGPAVGYLRRAGELRRILPLQEA